MNLDIKFKIFFVYLKLINYLDQNLNFLYYYVFIHYYSNRFIILNKKIKYSWRDDNNCKNNKYYDVNYDVYLNNKTIYFSNNNNNNYLNFSKCKFILVNLHSNDEKFDITKIIQGKKFNFMITNNILFDKFFFYFINNYYFNNKLNEKNYKFSLLDKDIKFINLDNDENIIINENNYQIIKNNKK